MIGGVGIEKMGRGIQMQIYVVFEIKAQGC